MVSFLPLNLCDEESIVHLLLQIDNAIQYGEDLDVREMKVNKPLISSHHIDCKFKGSVSHFRLLFVILAEGLFT